MQRIDELSSVPNKLFPRRIFARVMSFEPRERLRSPVELGLAFEPQRFVDGRGAQGLALPDLSMLKASCSENCDSPTSDRRIHAGRGAGPMPVLLSTSILCSLCEQLRRRTTSVAHAGTSRAAPDACCQAPEMSLAHLGRPLRRRYGPIRQLRTLGLSRGPDPAPIEQRSFSVSWTRAELSCLAQTRQPYSRCMLPKRIECTDPGTWSLACTAQRSVERRLDVSDDSLLLDAGGRCLFPARGSATRFHRHRFRIGLRQPRVSPV